MEIDGSKDALEEFITEAISECIGRVQVSVSGDVVRKEEDGIIIVVETEEGEEVKIDINDGIVDVTKDFRVGSTISNLPIKSAYFSIDSKELIFCFSMT